MSAYTGSQKAKCKYQFLPLGILFRFRGAFYLPTPTPRGTHNPKIKSSSGKKLYSYSTPPLKIRPPPMSLPSPEVSSSIKHE